MEAIVLAGGKGTRLQPVVKDIPKPMAEINNRPFLEYLLNYLSGQGVNRVILCVGYKYKLIQDYFKAEYNGMQIRYSIESSPLGTGGAAKKALSQCISETIFILNGDTFFDISLNKLLHFHQSKKADLTVALKQMKNFDRYGTVSFDKNNKITGFEEKKFCPEGFINGGVYLIKKYLPEEIQEEKFSLEKDFFEKFTDKLNFYAAPFDNYFIDIGIPQDYEQAQRDLTCIK